MPTRSNGRESECFLCKTNSYVKAILASFHWQQIKTTSSQQSQNLSAYLCIVRGRRNLALGVCRLAPDYRKSPHLLSDNKRRRAVPLKHVFARRKASNNGGTIPQSGAEGHRGPPPLCTSDGENVNRVILSTSQPSFCNHSSSKEEKESRGEKEIER